jgi:hypothetical protein
VGVEERMGAIGGDESVQWDKMNGADAVNGGGSGAGRLDRIQVLVRVRPLSEKEIARGEPAEWECINDTTIMFRSTFPDRPTAPTAYTFGQCTVLCFRCYLHLLWFVIPLILLLWLISSVVCREYFSLY